MKCLVIYDIKCSGQKKEDSPGMDINRHQHLRNHSGKEKGRGNAEEYHLKVKGSKHIYASCLSNQYN